MLEVLNTRVNVAKYSTMINQESTTLAYEHTKQPIEMAFRNSINAIPWGYGTHTNNPESATDHNATKQSENRSSSLSGRVGIRSHTNTNANLISSGGDGNDPEKYRKEKINHQCEIATGITSPPKEADTSESKENVSIYEDTFSSIIPKPSQNPRKDVFYDSAIDPFDENPSLSKLSSTKIAYGSVIPEIVLSPANTSENFLQKSQLSPKNETNKIQQDFLNFSGVKTPCRRTNTFCSYVSIKH